MASSREKDRFESKEWLYPPIVFLLVFGVLVSRLFVSDECGRPPNDWDGIYYESLALGVVDGLGFSPKLDTEFVHAYSHVPRIASGAYAEQLAREGIDSTTTYRPPIFPLIVAGIYGAFGREFLVVQIIQIALLALSATLLSCLLGRTYHGWVQLLVPLPFLLDPGMISFAVGGLTEPLMMVCMSTFMLLSSRALEVLSWRCALVCGFVLGVATLTRSAVAPLVFLMPIGLALCESYYHDRRERVLTLGVPMLLGALLVIIPWAVRNCFVLGAFMPLGSQSGIFLGQLYQDSLLNAGGYWTFEDTWDLNQALPSHVRGPARELALAHQGIERAILWIGSHLDSMPRIVWERLREFVWPSRCPDQKLWSTLILAGLFVLRQRSTFSLYKVTMVLCCAYGMVIVVTTNDYAGRYYYTLFPVVVLCFATCVEWIVNLVISRVRAILA